MRWLVGMAVAVAGVAVLAAASALAANQSVTATPSAQFAPKDVTLTQGESVTWTNTGGYHNVVFDDGSFTQPSGADPSLWTVSRVFKTVGTFRYYCVAHGGPGGSGMAGTVVVNQAAPGFAPDGAGSPSGGRSQPGSPQAVTPQSVGATCASKRKFRIRLRRPGGVRLASARVSVNGKPTKVSKRTIDGELRHTAEVDLRGLARGTYRVDIVAVTDRGKELRATRAYRTCADKQTPTSLPRL